MEVEANNCVGPLSSRSHFQQILVQLTNSKLIRNCVQLFCGQCYFGLGLAPTSLNRFQRPTNEFASEIATGNLISMFKLN